MNHIGERLSMIIEEQNISQAEFARSLSVTPNYINQIIKNKRTNISFHLARMIEEKYGYNLDWILNGEGDKIKVIIEDNSETIAYLIQQYSKHYPRPINEGEIQEYDNSDEIKGIFHEYFTVPTKKLNDLKLTSNKKPVKTKQSSIFKSQLYNGLYEKLKHYKEIRDIDYKDEILDAIIAQERKMNIYIIRYNNAIKENIKETYGITVDNTITSKKMEFIKKIFTIDDDLLDNISNIIDNVVEIDEKSNIKKELTTTL